MAVDCLDSSVLISALAEDEGFHTVCRSVLAADRSLGLYTHGLTETFNILTGGRRLNRMRASAMNTVLETLVGKRLVVTSLTPREMLRAMGEAEERGVRGGAIFDYLHLVAARKAKAEHMVTLDVSHFRAFWRPGDPSVVHPGEI